MARIVVLSDFDFDLVSTILLSKMNCLFFRWWKFAKFFMSFWKAQVSYLLNFASIFAVPSNITLLYFLHSNIIYFGQKEPIKVRIFQTFECLGQNSGQNCGVSFEMTLQFFFKFCIILHYYDTKLLCKFEVHSFSTLVKRIPTKSQF